MKKIICILGALACACFMFSAEPVKAGSKITVSPPSLQNGGEDDSWIPLFVQGQLTTDLQNYSGLIVIDRQAADAIMDEQKREQQKAFMNNETASVEYAALVNADYLVSVQVIKKGSSYSLTCGIQDVKTSTAVGKSYSEPNVSEQALNDGSALHAASYELLKGIGIAESNLSTLKEKSKNRESEVAANYYTAKGLAAEQKGGNVVEAMAYYQKAVGSSKSVTESAARLNTLTTTLPGVSMGKRAKNDMQLRKQWEKIWDDAHEYIRSNWAYVVYCPDLIELTGVDYNRNTATVTFPIFYKLNPECWELYCRLSGAYAAAKKNSVSDWGLDETLWAAGYGNNHRGTGAQITVFLANKQKGEWTAFARSRTDWGITMENYFSTYVLKFEGVNPELITDNLLISVRPNCKGGVVKTLPLNELMQVEK